jgi:hypothetical protein
MSNSLHYRTQPSGFESFYSLDCPELVGEYSGRRKGDILLFCALPRPSAGAEGGFEAPLVGGGCLPVVTAVRRAAGEAVADRLQFRLGLRAIDVLQPPATARHRAGVQRRPVVAGQSEAAVRPVLSAADQVGPQGVAFDVPQHGQQVLILLNGERLEASLPDVAAAAVMAMVPADVRGQQPLRPAAEVAVDEHDVERRSAPVCGGMGAAAADRADEVTDLSPADVLGERVIERAGLDVGQVLVFGRALPGVDAVDPGVEVAVGNQAMGDEDAGEAHPASDFEVVACCGQLGRQMEEEGRVPRRQEPADAVDLDHCRTWHRLNLQGPGEPGVVPAVEVQAVHCTVSR